MIEIWFYSNIPEYAWLSNFWSCPVKIGAGTYRSVEHYYQSEKTRDPRIRQWIKDAPTAYLAMRAGKAIKLREDWSIEERIRTMRAGLIGKFRFNKYTLGMRLIETGDAVLHEKSRHPLWGGLGGKDMLGKLLMEVREVLKDEWGI